MLEGDITEGSRSPSLFVFIHNYWRSTHCVGNTFILPGELCPPVLAPQMPATHGKSQAEPYSFLYAPLATALGDEERADFGQI